MQRADKIVTWALQTGRNPLDTAGMDSEDEEWIGENPEWEDYIEGEWNDKKQKPKPKPKSKSKTKSKHPFWSKPKTKPKKTVKRKRCPNGTRRNQVGECVSKSKANVQPKKECPGGQALNPKTNRCNKIKNTLKPCPPGKERNPKTNRCRNLISPKPKPKPKKPTKVSPKPKMSYFDAIQKDDLETVRALVNQHSDLSVTNEDGNTPLMYILGDRNAGDLREFFDVLAEASKDTLSHKNNDGDNALLMACYTCKETYIQKLIDLGADLTARNSNGQLVAEVMEDECGLSLSDFKDVEWLKQ